jgi:hypothetical protein
MGVFLEPGRAWLRPGCVAIALVLSLASCASGGAGDADAGDDGQGEGTDGAAQDSTVANDSAPPPKDSGGRDTAVAETSSGDDGSGSDDASDGAAVEAGGDATPDDAAHDGGADVAADVAADVTADVGADTGTDSGTDAGHDGSPDACAPCGPRSVCVGGVCTAAQRVFVSTGTYSGNLGGAAGANAKCQSLATAANLGGTWMAWVSDSNGSPNRSFMKATIAYRLLDGTEVATNWTALSSGTLSHAIDVDQSLASLAGATGSAALTWTSTATGGMSMGDSCTQFTSAASSGTGQVGSCTSTGATWTNASTTEACSAAHHLYCFEQ